MVNLQVTGVTGRGNSTNFSQILKAEFYVDYFNICYNLPDQTWTQTHLKGRYAHESYAIIRPLESIQQVYVETPLHPEKLTVWCTLWAGGNIGPYFFKNDEGHNVTVNGDRYRAMITNFFIPELNNHDVQELWFQQDGATCHTARATIDLLKDTFGDRLISRFGPVNLPPRSCDLPPDNIRRVIADIRPQMLEKVIENWTTSEIGLLPSQPWQSYARNHI
ncbi:DUF4817 domain-containing protein [Trichonephila clavipes]|nr:DUF4817 domain-containing protein [Trichonephila clavipes]